MMANNDYPETRDERSVPKDYFKMAVPLVMTLIVTIIYGLVDMYFVSATGDADLIAGVSLITPIYTMLMAFGDIFGYGGGALIAQYLGKKDYLKTKQISSFSFWCAFSSGIVISALMILFRDPVIHLLGANQQVYRHAESYYLWLVLAAPAVLVYCTFLNVVRSDGKARAAMIAVVAGTGVNLILDPVFIFNCGMGAAGASLSTFIGMAVEAGGCLIAGLRKNERLSISPKHIRLDGAGIRKIFSVGFSSSLTNAVQTVMLIVTNLYLIRYSTLAVSAMGIVQKVGMISYLLILGFALGGQPLLGRAFGAGEKSRMNAVLAFEMKVCIIVAILLTAAVEIFAPQIMSLFIDNQEIVSMGRQMLRIQYIATVFQAFVLVVFSLAISVGDAKSSFVLSVSRQGIVFIAAIVALAALFGYYGVISAQPAADIITAGIAFYLLKKRIRKNLL